MLVWAEVNYPQLEESKGIQETGLHHLIRFPYMTIQKLKIVLTDTNFNPKVASKIVLEALFLKTRHHTGSVSLHARTLSTQIVVSYENTCIAQYNQLNVNYLIITML